jgi:hypothetical protein
VFAKMFADVQDSRFKVLDVAASGEGGYLKWSYAGTFRASASSSPLERGRGA